MKREQSSSGSSPGPVDEPSSSLSSSLSAMRPKTPVSFPGFEELVVVWPCRLAHHARLSLDEPIGTDHLEERRNRFAPFKFL